MDVTFYFGAGASCNALPLVKDLPHRLLRMSNHFPEVWVQRDLARADRIKSIQDSQDFREFADALRWLSTNAAKHASVDTYAKKLYVRDEIGDLNRLKAVLSCFFLVEQAANPIDPRYDSFFASLVSRKNSSVYLPRNIKIVSWNYDLQFEYAFLEYSNSEQQVRQLLQSDPTTTDLDANKFALVRLNGAAGLHRNEHDEISRLMKWLPKDNDIEEIIRSFHNYSTNAEQFTPLLNFSWENNVYSRSYIPNAQTITVGTQCLVVVGYSFPFFNRAVDRSIIGQMTRLSTVYLQAPPEALPAVKSRFSAIRNDKVEVVSIGDTEQFYLPKEL